MFCVLKYNDVVVKIWNSYDHSETGSRSFYFKGEFLYPQEGPKIETTHCPYR